MEPCDDQLRPKQVDEQIEWLAQHAQEGTQNAQLIQRLQRYYEKERQQQTLKRAWKSIAQRYEGGLLSSSEEEHAQDEQRAQERVGQYRMNHQITGIQPARRQLPRWGVMVAIVVLALMVGSTAVIMSQAAQQKGASGTGGTGGNHPTCIPTPTGTVVPPTPMPTIPEATPTAPQVIPTPTPADCATTEPPTPTPAGAQPTPTPAPKK